MSQKSKTIVFFGNERLATGVNSSAPTLRKLVAAGYSVKAVIANQDVVISRKERQLEIQKAAEEFNIPVLLPNKLISIKEQLASFDAPVGILVAYGKIIPKEIISLFPKGIVNIHPSLLPEGRGPTPIESVILGRSKRTGVSIMKLVEKMDSGPVYAQEEIVLSGTESKQQLADRLLEEGGNLLIKHLPDILEGNILPTEQQDDKATYNQLISKKDGEIDWTKPAVQLEAEVRAFLGWPKSRTKIGDIEVVVTKARVVNQAGQPGAILSKDKSLVIATANGALEIENLIPINKSEMNALAFISGYGRSL